MDTRQNQFIVPTPLDIPTDACDNQGVVTFDINGHSQIGKWTFSVVTTRGSEFPKKVGELTIDIGPLMPDRAFQLLNDWIITECQRLEAGLLRLEIASSGNPEPTKARGILHIRLPAGRG
jgi:hypothetical protein